MDTKFLAGLSTHDEKEGKVVAHVSLNAAELQWGVPASALATGKWSGHVTVLYKLPSTLV